MSFLTLSKHERIYVVVKQIPYGMVASYGDIAQLAGLARHARLVGYALHASPETLDLPWHRVVNSQGQLSLGRLSTSGALEQQRLLLMEGIQFTPSGRVLMSIHRWQPHPLEWEAFILNF